MKSSSYGFLRAVVILLASATFSLAQTSGNYNNGRPATQQPAESVRPGSLNYVEGQVSSNGQILSPQAVGNFALEPGQSLQTGSGYAEVLLTPGAFLRIGPNSDFRLDSVGLADTRVSLVHGSAMLEADQMVQGTRLEVGVGGATADVLKKGLYSFNANPQTMRVLDGKLKVASATKTREIGGDDQILLANGDNLKKTDFDKSQAKSDPLYVWSEARSRAEANQNAMVAENGDGYAPVGRGWFWDPYAGYYGFWPAESFLYSPFGFGFYGGYYPGFYGGYGFYRGYRGFYAGHAASVHAYGGVHAFGGGFHGGGFHGGGVHGGGGGRR
jgi:hypothetical protein